MSHGVTGYLTWAADIRYNKDLRNAQFSRPVLGTAERMIQNETMWKSGRLAALPLGWV